MAATMEVHGGAGGLGLAASISEVYRADISLAEKRRLAGRLAEAAMRGCQPRPCVCDGAVAAERPDDHTGLLEETLTSVAIGTGCLGRVSISQAKAALRARGEPGRLLASRLGRLSKARNGVAHRDAGLKLAVAELFRGSGISVEEAGAAMQVEVSGPTQIEKINKVAEQEQGKTVGRCTELEGELLKLKAGHAAEVNEWRANLAMAAEALDHLREHCRSSRTK